MWVNVTIETKNERGNKVERRHYRIDSQDVYKALEPLQKLSWEYEDMLKLRNAHTNKFISQTTKEDKGQS